MMKAALAPIIIVRQELGRGMAKRQSHLIQYEEAVALKYQVYSALFRTLPFADMQSMDADVLTFQEYCRNATTKGLAPDAIVNGFFANVLHNQDFKFKIRILVLILQFLERQVVLLDALEDAAFPETHDLRGSGSLTHYLKQVTTQHKLDQSYQSIKDYRARIVLTAHPTQFYPLQVLEVIEDLAAATKMNDLNKISKLLLQLGKTSFKNSTRPTPVDEAEVHLYYLERIFYPVIKKMQCRLNEAYARQWAGKEGMPTLIELGFWPGGDRDGNASVTSESTMTVAKKLHLSILKIYVDEVERLKRRLTFPNMWPMLDKIKLRLNLTIHPEALNVDDLVTPYQVVDELMDDLGHLKYVLAQQHNSLFGEKIDDLMTAVRTFGFYFASLDIRQNSHVHTEVLQEILTYLVDHNLVDETIREKCLQYRLLSAKDKMEVILHCLQEGAYRLDDVMVVQNSMMADVIGSLRAIADIQCENGYKGLHRYIISHAQAAYNVMEVLLLAKFAGISADNFKVDVIPLFESIADLNNSTIIMKELYELPLYRRHLNRQMRSQVVMLGFSDGIKDGGYLMANWSILQCKLNLYKLSKHQNISIMFFDGRGGTPARGGGNIHKYYRAMNQIIDQQQVQVTIQGQTISSDFGTKYSAGYNIEQLLTAGLYHPLHSLSEASDIFSEEEGHLFDKLSQSSYDAYQKLKEHPLFISYMQTITPINFYGELNNASRPPRRTSGDALQLNDLRAIPYIGAWSQIKQIAPVYFGIGTAIKSLIDQGQESSLKELYHNSLYFRTLLQNAMQSLLRTNFSITEYLRHDPVFNELWKILYDETTLSMTMLMRISDQTELLENDPVTQRSIMIRESIVIPLSIIQQYALIELRKCTGGQDSPEVSAYKKLILKSLAANTNASRNST